MNELEFIDYMTDKIFSYEGELDEKLVNTWTYEWIGSSREDPFQIKRVKISAFVDLWEAMTGRDYSNYIEEVGD